MIPAIIKLLITIKKIKAPIGDENSNRTQSLIYPRSLIKKIKAPIGDENHEIVMLLNYYHN